MNSGKKDFADKMFEAFATTSKSRYIFICNMETGISRWSKNAVEFFGMPGEYMDDVVSIWKEHIHPDDREIFLEDIGAIFSGKKKEHDLEYRAKDKNGNYVMCTCRGKVIDDDDGEPAFFAGTIINHGIIDSIDPTTNLYNLYEFFNYVRGLTESKRNARVMMVGFKRFSDVNEVYGYTFGNEVMRRFADMFLAMARKTGAVFRMDGSKFALCTTQASVEELKELYIDLQDIIQNRMEIDGHRINIALCGSVVCVDDFDIDEHVVYASARYALERSKNEKLGELVIVNEDNLSNNIKTVEIISDLRRSVENGCEGFYLCYQPVVSSGTGELVGMEALLRWKKEPYGDIPPGLFIPWIENDRIFFELGNWILRTALEEGKELLKDYPNFLINVNLSYTQLERSEFRSAIVDILESTGFPPQNLCLELTERCRLLDLAFLRNEVIFLKSYGIKIALDDFGTGFSSLNLLRELPVDCIKIDRGFVKDIETSVADQSIVGAVTQCAQTLDINVCVEGIETEELRDYMKKYYSTSYQGYYYSKPVPMEIFKQLPIYESGN